METTFGTGGLSREVCSHQETRSWIFFSLVAGNHSLNVFYYNCCDLCNENVGSVEKNTLFFFSFFFLHFTILRIPGALKSTARVTVIPTVITELHVCRPPSLNFELLVCGIMVQKDLDLTFVWLQ